MARVSTYLNFPGNTEEAFLFYRSVFGGEFGGKGIIRMGDFPPSDNVPEISKQDRNLVMHVELKILADHVIMGTDATESMGFHTLSGNQMYINLEPDTRQETDILFRKLSQGGVVSQELQEEFWGGYFGSCTDRFGVQWMFNCESE